MKRLDKQVARSEGRLNRCERKIKDLEEHNEKEEERFEEVLRIRKKSLNTIKIY